MKPKSVRKRLRSQNIHLGFQIAPMIDVVFVILLFFIVAASGARRESSLSTVLPGGETHCGSSPDPVELRIDEAGQVYLPRQAPWLAAYLSELLAFPAARNDDQVDSTSQALKHLTAKSPMIRERPERLKRPKSRYR